MMKPSSRTVCDMSSAEIRWFSCGIDFNEIAITVYVCQVQTSTWQVLEQLNGALEFVKLILYNGIFESGSAHILRHAWPGVIIRNTEQCENGPQKYS